MRSIERTEAAFRGETPDRAPFVPSIYEHGAALLGKTPSAVARDPQLMAQAAIAAFETYAHDLVTVGIDIYNIEAEALGCEVRYHEDSSAIPGVVSHPLMHEETLNARSIALPVEDSSSNRLGLIVEACSAAFRAIGRDVWVYGCIGGPFSQAVELRGFENLLMDIVTNPDEVHALMRVTTELSMRHAGRLSKQGVGINVYESWATLPLIDPRIFEQFVVPYERTIIQTIRSDYRTPPPAVIMGGNVTELIRFFVETGTSLIAADYNTDFGFVRRFLDENDSDIVVRGCADPKMIERREWDGVERAVAVLAEKSRGMNRFVWGCGCVSYDTAISDLLRFKELCLGQPRRE